MANVSGAGGNGSRPRLISVSSSLDQQQSKQNPQEQLSKAYDRRSSVAVAVVAQAPAVANFEQVATQKLMACKQVQANRPQVNYEGGQRASVGPSSQEQQYPARMSSVGPRRPSSSENQGCYYYLQQQQHRGDPMLDGAGGPTAPFCANRTQANRHHDQPAAAWLMRYNSFGPAGARAAHSASPTKSPYFKDDVDIVFNRLMALEAFRKLHPTVIRNLCSYASIERIDKGVIVFRQGDDAINWYALLEGSVDVKVSQSGGQKKSGSYQVNPAGASEQNDNNNNNISIAPDGPRAAGQEGATRSCNFPDQSSPHATNGTNQDGVTLCTLGVGTTFGASVMPGKSHSVSVVTSDDCTLLRVRRADFQEIFNEQSHLINNVESSPFCSFTSLNRIIASNSLSRRTPGGRAEQVANADGIVGSGAQNGPPREERPHGEEEEEDEDEEGRQMEAGLLEGEREQEEEELAELNLEAIDSNELPSHLMRIGWALRTLMLDMCPAMIQDRLVYPARAHKQHQQRQQAGPARPVHRQLVAMASSSQLLGSSASSASSSSGGTKSAASAAGRKVANYVASSFMRSNNKAAASLGAQQSAARPAEQSHAMFTSNSFDADLVGGGGQASTRAANQQPAQQGQAVLFKRCMVGQEMVDWLVDLGRTNTSAARFVGSRLQAVSMWQVLLEQGIVFAFNESKGSTEPAGQPAPPSQSRQNQQQQQQQTQCQFQFCDDQLAYYKFWFDREGTKQTESSAIQRPSEADLALASESLWWSLKVLSKLAPDACFRLILSRRPHERSLEEVDIVYEELQHLKALSHLTNSVKKELAACVTSEHHAKQNTVLFNQGDVGQSWYIILRGSVNVVIVGKGVVCTLHEGDDFGKLALVNDAPRAATIVTNEPNCYFLRVDKLDFDRILKHVEANTVRLREHGKEVLILQRVPAKELAGAGQPQAAAAAAAAAACATAEPSSGPPTAGEHSSGAGGVAAAATTQQAAPTQPSAAGQQSGAAQTPSGGSSALKYMVMAGTSEKMLEHLLETRIDGHTQIGPLLACKSGLIQHDQVSGYIQCNGDNFLEDFILTHKIFMPTASLCLELLKQYQCQTKSQLSNSQQAAPLESSGEQLPQSDFNCRPGNRTRQQQQQQQQQTGEHTELDDEYLIAKKRRVVKFVRCWMLITREHFFHQQQIQSFLTNIHQRIAQDAARFASLQPELAAIARILELHLEEEQEGRQKGVQRWIYDTYGNILPIRRHSGVWELSQTSSAAAGSTFLASLHQRRLELKLSNIQANDEIVFRVYCTDHSFTTLRTRVDEQAGQIKQLAAKELKLADKELILVHVKSNGERIIYNDLEFNITTSLSVNGRLFVCPLDHIDAISPLPEQDPFQEVYQALGSASGAANSALAANELATANPSNAASNSGGRLHEQQQQQQLAGNQTGHQTNTPQTIDSAAGPINSHLLVSTPTNYADIKTQMSLSVTKLEEFSSRDVAYCLTQIAWSLLRSMHEFELIYTVFGRHNFKQVTANLNIFLRHFNEIQYWVVTQICLSTSLSKRVQILRKFIKIAAHCKEMQNLNAFFAIIMGLSNMAVARLTQTWERLPNKLKRTFSQFESLIDPSRNHRRYRIFISRMEPPIIPFMPLFLKDMTFAHEGNKTYLENGLINFEKMQMVAQTLRTIRYCKSRPMKLDSSACKFKGSIRSIELFFRDLKIVDNQRTLTQMSHQLEHRKT